ncbi:MAG: hypothetical protein KY460_16255 [Actinobacteria bacterium]|nr:hypothetical protein [Actinomycetota bacterium]
MTEFDRIAPPPTETGPAQVWRRIDGRRAVFSVGGDGPSAVDRWLECTVRCDRCARQRSVSPTRLLLACVPFALVVPWRTHPLLARCPACGQVAWLRVRYPAETLEDAADPR